MIFCTQDGTQRKRMNYLNEEKKEGMDGRKKRTMKRMNFYKEDETQRMRMNFYEEDEFLKT